MIDLAKPMSGLLGPAAGLEAGVREFFAEQFQRHAVLQRDRDGQRKAVHQAADGGSFFRHGDEEFAGLAVGIEADGDVALVAADVEFVRDRRALVLQLVPHGARRRVQIFFFVRAGAPRPRIFFLGVAVLVPAAESGCDFLHPSR